MPELTHNVLVRNRSGVRQSVGFTAFAPHETKEIPERYATDILKYPQFEQVEREAHPNDTPAAQKPPGRPTLLPPPPVVREVRKAIQPDPISPAWVTAFNRDVFPSQTNEFDSVAPAPKPFSITFRLVSISEMNGGTRFILRLAGWLGQRGHDVTVSASQSDVTQEDLEDMPVTLHVGPDIPDADFVVGTYWLTIEHVIKSKLSGRKIGMLQAPEPSWPDIGRAKQRATASFTDGDVTYFTIGEALAKECRRLYGANVTCELPGSCIDNMAFSPRINDHKPRETVFFIYRSAEWKGVDVVLKTIAEYKLLRPKTRVVAAGFSRWSHELVDDYRIDPPSDDMPQLYSEADFYLSAGIYEGSPLPPLEAMACGCIPVVTESGMGDYLVDGVNGLLLNPTATGGAAKRMAAVMANEEQRQLLKRNGLLTARDRPMARLFSAFEDGVLAVGGR